MFFHDTSTTEIYTLSLHDALPIFNVASALPQVIAPALALRILALTQESYPGVFVAAGIVALLSAGIALRSEEHTSELQSLRHLVCRLLLEKKKKHMKTNKPT